VHDIGAPAADVPAQAPEHAEVEPSPLLVDNHGDIGARELVDARDFPVQRVDAHRVPEASQLPRQHHDLAFGAAQTEPADHEENSHRRLRTATIWPPLGALRINAAPPDPAERAEV
jgi:hypothetical protein